MPESRLGKIGAGVYARSALMSMATETFACLRMLLSVPLGISLLPSTTVQTSFVPSRVSPENRGRVKIATLYGGSLQLQACRQS